MANDVYCYEAGHRELGPSVVLAQAGDRVHFPHLDSCMAMLFVLQDRRVVAAHVVQVEENQPFDLVQIAGNSMRYFTMMQGLQSRVGAPIIHFATFADDPADNFNRRGLRNLLPAGIRHEHIDLNCDGGGINLCVHGDDWHLSADDCKVTPGGGRPRFPGVPRGQQPVLHVP